VNQTGSCEPVWFTAYKNNTPVFSFIFSLVSLSRLNLRERSSLFSPYDLHLLPFSDVVASGGAAASEFQSTPIQKPITYSSSSFSPLYDFKTIFLK
jgi:hypothetical protein